MVVSVSSGLGRPFLKAAWLGMSVIRCLSASVAHVASKSLSERVFWLLFTP